MPNEDPTPKPLENGATVFVFAAVVVSIVEKSIQCHINSNNLLLTVVEEEEVEEGDEEDNQEEVDNPIQQEEQVTRPMAAAVELVALRLDHGLTNSVHHILQYLNNTATVHMDTIWLPSSKDKLQHDTVVPKPPGERESFILLPRKIRQFQQLQWPLAPLRKFGNESQP